MGKTQPAIALGQRWSLRDDRYEGWRYLTIQQITDTHVIYSGNTRRPRPIARDRFGKGWRWSYCGHDGPGILPPYTADGTVTLGCFPYGRHATILPLTYELEPGFGCVEVTRDGNPVFRAMRTRKRLAHIELKARDFPGDWRLRIDSPLSERLYQRQDAGWVLVAIGHGFA